MRIHKTKTTDYVIVKSKSENNLFMSCICPMNHQIPHTTYQIHIDHIKIIFLFTFSQRSFTVHSTIIWFFIYYYYSVSMLFFSLSLSLCLYSPSIQKCKQTFHSVFKYYFDECAIYIACSLQPAATLCVFRIHYIGVYCIALLAVTFIIIIIYKANRRRKKTNLLRFQMSCELTSPNGDTTTNS